MEPPCCAIGEATDLGRSKPTTLINCIRALRFVADEMTQAELAREVGVTRQTIIAIEKGKYAPSLEVAFRIAPVSYTHLRAHETREDLVCRLLLEKKNKKQQ